VFSSFLWAGFSKCPGSAIAALDAVDLSRLCCSGCVFEVWEFIFIHVLILWDVDLQDPLRRQRGTLRLLQFVTKPVVSAGDSRIRELPERLAEGSLGSLPVSTRSSALCAALHTQERRAVRTSHGVKGQ